MLAIYQYHKWQTSTLFVYITLMVGHWLLIADAGVMKCCQQQTPTLFVYLTFMVGHWLEIADVAVMKRCQLLEETWPIFTCTSSRKSSKLLLRIFCHAIYALDTWCMQSNTHTRAHCYVCQTSHASFECLCYWQVVSWNKFSDIPYSAGRNIMMVFPNSNICYLWSISF